MIRSHVLRALIEHAKSNRFRLNLIWYISRNTKHLNWKSKSLFVRKFRYVCVRVVCVISMYFVIRQRDWMCAAKQCHCCLRLASAFGRFWRAFCHLPNSHETTQLQIDSTLNYACHRFIVWLTCSVLTISHSHHAYICAARGLFVFARVLGGWNNNNCLRCGVDFREHALILSSASHSDNSHSIAPPGGFVALRLCAYFVCWFMQCALRFYAPRTHNKYIDKQPRRERAIFEFETKISYRWTQSKVSQKNFS